MKYGHEGRHYVKDGEFVVLPQESTRLRVMEVNALYTLMIADMSNPNLMKIKEQESLTEIAERLTADNEKFIVRDPTVSLESVTYDERNAELNKIISDATYNYILGQLDEAGFKKEIERWKQNGGDQIIKEFTQGYFGSAK